LYFFSCNKNEITTTTNSNSNVTDSTTTAPVDALKCYSCLFTGGPDACETAPIMTCTNSTYCLSKYATVDDQDIWAHSCAQDLFEDDILGNDILFCQNKGNGCFKQEDFEYDYYEDTHYSVTDIYYCCCDSDLCNTNSENSPDNGVDGVQFSVLSLSAVLMAFLV